MDEVKLSLIIEVPARPVEFESAFPALLDLAGTMPGLLRIETARIFPCRDGSPSPVHRTLDLYFDSYRTASRATDTPLAKTFFDGLTGAGGRFTRLLGHVETHATACAVPSGMQWPAREAALAGQAA
ncbi:EthD family reductase [Agromyces humatus]|uniref:EthD family reductase n=1 Tax=Agromyces humatus TaxID=279573 RepID=A0ABP4WTN0_9MICO|nr:EthD family reductase [Agromyces humatus]